MAQITRSGVIDVPVSVSAGNNDVHRFIALHYGFAEFGAVERIIEQMETSNFSRFAHENSRGTLVRLFENDFFVVG